MSTSTPSESRRSPEKAASTTYVAPCSRWAGPKASPRKLWAIIMWSRTVTVNTSLLPVVDDAVAEPGQGTVGHLGHQPRQLLEPRLPGEQRVEGRILQQPQRE